MITDEELGKALDWLVNNASKAAAARAERIYVEEWRKVLKAQLMKASTASSVAAQETEAYGHPDYAKHLEAIRAAVEADERFRWLQVAAEAKIEAFRTLAANNRAQGKVG